MRRRPLSTTVLTGAAALLLVAVRPTATRALQSRPPAPIELTDTPTKADQLARAFLDAINDLRAEEQSPPLQISGPLSRAARNLLDRALFESVTADFDAEAKLTREDLRQSEYEPRQWVEGLASSTREPAEFVALWRQANPKSLEAFLDSELRDFGLAAEVWATQSFYALVAATSLSETNRPIIEQLSDLDTVRHQLLARVNEERERRKTRPLRPSRALNSAAQAYADRMMQEGFYGHVSPRGDTVLERVRAGGYEPALTGENLASGQQTAEQAMDHWMASKGHRDNILERGFRDIGVGVSVLESDGELKILWVQFFARRKP